MTGEQDNQQAGRAEVQHLLNMWTPSQLRQAARAAGIRIKQPNGNRVPIGAICTQLIDAGVAP